MRLLKAANQGQRFYEMTAPGDLRHGQATAIREVIKYSEWNMN